MKYDCVGVGMIALDHLVSVDRYPETNSKNIARRVVNQGGGPVPTALAVLGKFGKKCAVVTKIGVDAAGTFLKAELTEFHIDTKYIVSDAEITTPEAFIIVDEKSGDRTVILHRAERTSLIPGDLPEELLRNCRLLHLDGHDGEANLYAAKKAKENGAAISIDIGSAREIDARLIDVLDYAIVSENYADEYLQKNDPAKSAEMLLQRGTTLCAVTCGERGSYFASSDGIYHQPAFPVNAVDTTGAGDVFHGAALYGILEGWTVQQTASFASAAAALACTKMGGKTGISDFSEIKGFLKKREIDTHFIKSGGVETDV
ncbi:MAG: hypothetical protein GWP06_10700 [Actinobacteria bacterium]|nr:hypothetical protein [Actinomycetota bacterium]